jgi:Protein of unknown function (DUF3343).
MKEYLATFYSHYEAIKFKNRLLSEGLAGRLTSVPRSLSSSCGTCCRFSSEGVNPAWKDYSEALYEHAGDNWTVLYEKN